MLYVINIFVSLENIFLQISNYFYNHFDVGYFYLSKFQLHSCCWLRNEINAH